MTGAPGARASSAIAAAAHSQVGIVAAPECGEKALERHRGRQMAPLLRALIDSSRAFDLTVGLLDHGSPFFSFALDPRAPAPRSQFQLSLRPVAPGIEPAIKMRSVSRGSSANQGCGQLLSASYPQPASRRAESGILAAGRDKWDIATAKKGCGTPGSLRRSTRFFHCHPPGLAAIGEARRF